MKKILLFSMGFLLILSACEKDNDTEEIQNEPICSNFYDYPFINAKDIKDNGQKTLGSVIVDETDRFFGVSPYHALETDGILPSDYVLTGIGLRAASSTVTTMVLEGRKVNLDGSMGARVRFYYGSEPNHALEVWLSVPDGCVIYGFGARAAGNDFTTLSVTYRTLNSNLRLSGMQTIRTGTEPNHALEASYTLPAEFDPERSIVTGVGTRLHESDFNTLKVTIGTLK